MSPKVSDEYKQQKKKELLQAAKQVFMDKGYTQATMQDIMDKADVSRGALYAYFDNIEHVYLEVLKEEDRQDADDFHWDGSGTCWKQLERWMDRKRQEIEAIEQSLFLANAEFFLSQRRRRGNEGTGTPYWMSRYQVIVDAVSDFIRKGETLGHFSPCMPAESISRYLVSFIDGLMIDTAHLGPECTKVPEQMEVLTYILRQMLRPSDLNLSEQGK